MSLLNLLFFRHLCTERECVAHCSMGKIKRRGLAKHVSYHMTPLVKINSFTHNKGTSYLEIGLYLQIKTKRPNKSK